eukprot:1086226-Prorocentrum_minimum.AAC.1
MPGSNQVRGRLSRDEIRSKRARWRMACRIRWWSSSGTCRLLARAARRCCHARVRGRTARRVTKIQALPAYGSTVAATEKLMATRLNQSRSTRGANIT